MIKRILKYLYDLFSDRAGVDDKTTTPMTISLRGMFTEVDMGNFKAGDLATLKCSIACRYYSLDIGGQKVIEIDVDNMVRNINGKDVLADIRSALGV